MKMDDVNPWAGLGEVTGGGGQARRISRAHLLAWGGSAGVALAAIPGVAGAFAGGRTEFPFYPAGQGTYAPENIGDILDMLLTMERFAVSAGTANYNAPAQPGINPLLITAQQSSNVTTLAHVDFLESQGAQALTDTFTLGGSLGVSVAALQRKERITTIFVGAYLAAAREFAELGQPLLVKWAFQAGAQLAEERAVARALQAIGNVPDASPPVNKAFETDLFLYVRDAYALMTKIGLFGGLPIRLPYPTREAVLATAGPIAAKVLQKIPNNATSSVVSPAVVTQERQ